MAKMKWIYLVAMLPLQLKAQLGSHGSFCIGAIGKDGIILAADSREMFYDRRIASHPPMCYHDSMQKVFFVKGYGLAFVGESTFSGWYIRAVLNDYAKTDFTGARADSIIFHFLKYCKKVMPGKDYSVIDNLIIMSVGYYKGHPFVCMKNNMLPSGYVINPRSRLFVANCTFIKYFRDSLSCDTLSKLAAQSIYEYAKDENKQYMIGGEINVLKIEKEGTYKWLVHSPSRYFKWNTINDMEKTYKAGQLKIYPVAPYTINEIRKVLLN